MKRCLNYKVAISLFIWISILFGAAQAGAAETLKVITGVPPYGYLAKRLGGDYLSVQVLLDASEDPHTFEPRPKKIMSLGGARVFFSAGMEFEERLLARIKGNFSDLTVVDLSEGLTEEAAAGETVHHHDPHIWLSPTLLIGQVEKMAQTLSKIDSDHAGYYQQNLKELQKELRQLHERIAKMLSPFRGRSFLVYHPAFAYFGRDFGLKQVAVEADGGKPSPRQLGALLALARKEKVKVVFVQPQFDRASAQVLAASIDGVVLAMDPLAWDVMENFSKMAEKLEQAFE